MKALRKSIGFLVLGWITATSAFADPPVKVEVGSPEPYTQKEAKIRAVDPNDYPETYQKNLQASLDKVAHLTGQLKAAKELKRPISVFLIDSSEETAVFIKGFGGEPHHLGISLGMLKNIGNDQELEYVLGQELRRGLSRIQGKIDRSDKSDLKTFLLKRAVHTEVDVGSALDMLERGSNPYAAIDFLERLKGKYGDRLSKSKTLLQSRINDIGSAITGAIRSGAVDSDRRLDQTSRTRDLTDSIQKLLFSDDTHAKVAASRLDKLVSAQGAADQDYKAVVAGTPERVQTVALDQRGRQKASPFLQVLLEIKDEIDARYPEITGEEKIRLQFKLNRNLHNEFEKSRDAITAGKRESFNAKQRAAMELLEDRQYWVEHEDLYSEDISVKFAEEEIAELKKKISGTSKPEVLADLKAQLEHKEMELARAQKDFNLALSVYDYTPEALAGLRKSGSSVSSLRLVPMFDGFDRYRHAGFKVKEIDDLVVDAPERILRYREANALSSYEQIDDIRELEDWWHLHRESKSDQAIGVLKRASVLAKDRLAAAKELGDVLEVLGKEVEPFSKFARYNFSEELEKLAKTSPETVEAIFYPIAKLVVEKGLPEDSHNLIEVTSLLDGLTSYLGEKGTPIRERVSQAIEAKYLKDIESYGKRKKGARGMLNYMRQLRPMRYEQRETNDAIAFAASMDKKSPGNLLKGFAEALLKSAESESFKMTQAQAEALVVVALPDLMPSEWTLVDRQKKIGDELTSLAKNPEFASKDKLGWIDQTEVVSLLHGSMREEIGAKDLRKIYDAYAALTPLYPAFPKDYFSDRGGFSGIVLDEALKKGDANLTLTGPILRAHLDEREQKKALRLLEMHFDRLLKQSKGDRVKAVAEFWKSLDEAGVYVDLHHFGKEIHAFIVGGLRDWWRN